MNDNGQKPIRRVPPPPQPPNSREALKRRLFQKIDVDGDSFLNKEEMRTLASMVGFEGTADDWDQEYRKLCSEENVFLEQGVPQDMVLRLLDDQTDTGCYCTDEELKCLVSAGKDDIQGQENTSVFFAGASFDAREATLREHFNSPGQVKEFKLFKTSDGRSRGMGIVTYATQEEADRASSQLHQAELDGRSVSVSAHVPNDTNNSNSEKSHERDSRGRHGAGETSGPRRTVAYDKPYASRSEPVHWQSEWYGAGPKGGKDVMGGANSTVYFAGAPFNASPDKLKALFQECGRVTKFWLFQLEDGRSRGQGVVEFSSPAEMRYCVEYLDGKRLGEQKLKVQEGQVGALHQPQTSEGYSYSWGGSKSSRKGEHNGRGKHGQAQQASNAGPCRIFFSGVPSATPLPKVRAGFEEYGEVLDFIMFRHKDGKPRGMGIVVYKFPQSGTEVMTYGTQMEGWHLFMQEAEEARKSQQDWEDYNYADWEISDRYFDEVEDWNWPEWYKGNGKGESWHDGKGGWWRDGKGGKDTGKGFQDYRSYSTPDWHDDYKHSADDLNVDPDRSIFFANVPFETTEAYLWQRFEAAGLVTRLRIYQTKDGKSRGMGVVEYKNRSAARNAYSMLHGTSIGGRRLLVDEIEVSSGKSPVDYY